MDQEKQIQQKYLEFQMLQQQAEQIHQYIQELDAKFSEYNQTKEALSELKKLKPGSEIFAPVAPGMFVKAELKDTNELFVNIGANAAAIKDLPQATELINRQISAVQQTQSQLDSKLAKLSQQIEEIVKQLQKSEI